MQREEEQKRAQIVRIAKEYENESPQAILRFALENYSPNIAISFSGAEDVVLIDMAMKIRDDVRVFTLDTGRLHGKPWM